MQIANLALRFVVEVMGVGFVGYWGFSSASNPLGRVILGLVAIGLFVGLWGWVLAPTAASGLSRMQKNLLGTVVLLIAAAALALAGQPGAAAVYGLVVVGNLGLLVVLGDTMPGSVANLGDPH